MSKCGHEYRDSGQTREQNGHFWPLKSNGRHIAVKHPPRSLVCGTQSKLMPEQRCGVESLLAPATLLRIATRCRQRVSSPRFPPRNSAGGALAPSPPARRRSPNGEGRRPLPRARLPRAPLAAVLEWFPWVHAGGQDPYYAERRCQSSRCVWVLSARCRSHGWARHGVNRPATPPQVHRWSTCRRAHSGGF